MVGHVQVELAHTPSRRNDLIQISSEVQEKTKESLNSNTQESLKTPQPNGEHNKTKQETRNFRQLIPKQGGQKAKVMVMTTAKNNADQKKEDLFQIRHVKRQKDDTVSII